jgi:uncharacterized protein (DUF1330 family)
MENRTMPAYIIAQLNFTDTSYMAEYRAGVVPLLKKHGGRQLVGGQPAEKLEGDWELPDRAIVLEFPSMEHARAWYNDPEYAPLITLRQSGAISKLMLVDGMG